MAPAESGGGPEVEVIMPVFDEADSIRQTLEEWQRELAPRVRFRFGISEDGSRDNTKEVLRRCAEDLPASLDMTDERRGYGGAVLAAAALTSAPWVLAVDSDGQCSPADFWPFWEQRGEADVLIGWRVRRMDPLYRRLMSTSFKLLHRLLFGVRLHDPSCPYVLMRREVLERLTPHLGRLPEGFWWEFTAWCQRVGFHVRELPIEHRQRAAGETVVFRPSRVPRIALRNGIGLLATWWRTRGVRP